jgi:hypothetical protein
MEDKKEVLDRLREIDSSWIKERKVEPVTHPEVVYFDIDENGKIKEEYFFESFDYSDPEYNEEYTKNLLKDNDEIYFPHLNTWARLWNTPTHRLYQNRKNVL